MAIGSVSEPRTVREGQDLGWKRKTLIGVAATYAGLAIVTREPDRAVFHLPRAVGLLFTNVAIVDPRRGTVALGMPALLITPGALRTGQGGPSPLRVLQMTTSDSADFLGRIATMGEVAPGRNADLVLLDGDPTRAVANLHRVAGVARAGFYYDAKALAALRERLAAGKGVPQ